MSQGTQAVGPVSVDLFDKCASARLDEYRAADSLGVLPYFREMAGQSGPVVHHEGRPVIMLGSNNYLGLTSDERVKRGAVAAIEEHGSGCTGSRLMNGTLAVHLELEAELADWLGGEAALVFTTGYSVNLGVVSTLVSSRDVVLVDAASHASLIDGGRLSSGSLRSFRHNSVPSLRRRLDAVRADARGGGVLVTVDGVYSMEGDVAPVGAVADLCAAYGSRLLVDEAHALGVLGPRGAGAAAAAGVVPDLIMGTFSKSLASCGGFVVGPRAVIDYLRIACRPFLFTASGVPAAMAAALVALRIARDEEWRRQAIRERADQLREGLRRLGFEVAPEDGAAIVAVHVGGEWEAAALWRALLDNGVYTNCAVPPAVAPGRALLRTSVMATHTVEQIDRALLAFEVARSTSG